MDRRVLVRYGELALKSEPVRREFEKILVQNIKLILDEIPSKIETRRGRIIIETPEPEEAAPLVANIPGVVSSSPTWRTDAFMEDIRRRAGKIAQASFSPDQSFAVRARRTGEHEFGSKDVEEEVGSDIQENFPDMSVDLDSPAQELHVEVRNDDAYIFTEIEDGVGGLPVGAQGRAVALFSGRIESAVSSYLVLKRGVPVNLLFLDPNRKSRGLDDRVLPPARGLLKFHADLDLYIAPFKPILDEISKKVPPKLRWIICQRMSLRVGGRIAKKVGAKALVSDINFNRMASNILQKIQIVEEKTDLPVLHPLIGFNEDQIQEIAGGIEASELSGEDLRPCRPAPSRPVRVDLKEVHGDEGRIAEDSLIKSTLKSLEVHKLGD